jgi:hypothetical protein
MGIFAVMTGDFRRIGLAVREFGSAETLPRIAKPAIGGIFSYYRLRFFGPPDCLADLGGIELPYSQLKKAH